MYWSLIWQKVKWFVQHVATRFEAKKRLSHAGPSGEHGLFEKEFDWVLIQPGPGHIEMNNLKSFVKLMWGIFYEYMIEPFKFRSENAKKSAFKENDHHKGMALAHIARYALGRELVLPYVRRELESREKILHVCSPKSNFCIYLQCYLWTSWCYICIQSWPSHRICTFNWCS